MVEDAVHSLVRCYQNRFPTSTIFAIRHPIAVYWGSPSTLEVDLMCMRELRLKNKDWKVYLNPAGSELPIQSMSNFRRMLKDANGSLVESYPNLNTERFQRLFEMQRVGANEHDVAWKEMGYDKHPNPFNLTIRKGSKNVALLRSFTDFIIENPFAWSLLDWLKSGFVADEHFYSTIVTVTDTDDGGTVYRTTIQDLRDRVHEDDLRVRYSEWVYERAEICDGVVANGICNFGVGDLDRVFNASKHLMANKFSLKADPVAVVCHAKRWRTL